MPTAAVDGVTLYYEERGTGSPLIFVHGIPTDYRAWTRQTEAFGDAYRTVTYSRRYAAPNKRSGDLLDSTIGNNAGDLKRVIDKLGLAPVNLVGHSYGGFISAFLTADHPDLIRSLTLVEPAISTMLVVDEKSPAQMLGLLLRSPSVALSARKFQNTYLYPSLKALDNQMTDKATELMVDGVQGSPGAFGRLAEDDRKMMLENGRTIGELKTKFPVFRKEEARRIACRTLVLNGESSPLWLRRIGELLAGAIPKSEYARIPNSAHFPHIQNPAEFNRRLRTFLSAA